MASSAGGARWTKSHNVIIIIIILFKFTFNKFLNLYNQHVAMLIKAGCITYNKIHYKYITLYMY